MPQGDPVASPKAIVHSGCARLTVLTPRLVRMERACSGTGCRLAVPTFDDRATFAVINRRLPVPEFKVERNESTLVLTTAALQLTHRLSSSHLAPDSCHKDGFAEGELEVTLLVAPFSTWTYSKAPTLSGRFRSSVAHIVPEAGNLNGTMDYGPSFAGGLDCYSNPPECAEQYRQVLGLGLVSRSGFALVNDTNNTRLAARQPGHGTQWFVPESTRSENHWLAEDLYLLVSGRNYTRALGDWASIGGAPSLPPLAALGIWYSRYYPYGATTFKDNVISKYRDYELPLSVGVLDVPWHNIDYPIYDIGPDKNGSWPYPNVPGTAKPGHSCNDWDGFTFNRTLFPDPKVFFDEVHAEGMKMILSVHMQDGIDHCQEQYLAMAHAMGFSDEQIQDNKTVECYMDNATYVNAFFKHIVESAPVAGTADWWWLDYPGGASSISGWDQQEPASVWWSNHMFAEHAREVGQRPVILARYGGLGQQRDGLGFSGDTFQEYSTLEFEVEMTPMASNVLFGWWSHDIGGNHNGHTTGYDKHGNPTGPYPGDEDPTNRTGSEMLLRWIQFGVVSPIFRTHCEPSCDRYVWHYPHFNQMRAAMRLRDALVPYIYTAGFEAYQTGVSLLRPMYYQWPDDASAYQHPGQYMFGPHILAAPVSGKSEDNVTTAKDVWLPPLEGHMTGWLHWNGTAVHAKPGAVFSARWSLEEMPLFVRPGTVIPTRTSASTRAVFADPVVWTVWASGPGSSGKGMLFEDAGDGLEYTHASSRESTRAFSATTEASLVDDRNASMLTFTVEPTRGNHSGQQQTRAHAVQFRGVSYAPGVVTVNGQSVQRMEPGSKGPGWYISRASADDRDLFTEPAGVLVVLLGRHDIRGRLHVTVVPGQAAQRILVL